jgi:hypothetical protein
VRSESSSRWRKADGDAQCRWRRTGRGGRAPLRGGGGAGYSGVESPREGLQGGGNGGGGAVMAGSVNGL